jgi:hypothetical protein
MLSVLQEKLAEAHGLAIASGVVLDEVEQRLADGALRRELREVRREAEETRARCLDAEASLGTELARELLAHAQTTKEHAADLVGAWFRAGAGPLRAWTFLAMAEAAEVAAWSALGSLVLRGGDAELQRLADWALPIQERHLRLALDGAVRLARAADPAAPRFG